MFIGSHFMQKFNISCLFQSLLLRTRMGEVVLELTSTKTQLTIGYVKTVENAKEVDIAMISSH